ncbi:MAG: ABC transporter permease, partial [Mycobacteriales bacterium]
DIEQGIGMVIRMFFFLSPVLWPLSRLSPSMQKLDAINPMVGVLAINRATWLPAYWTGWTPVLYSALGSVVVLVLGFSVFARVERAVLKEL